MNSRAVVGADHRGPRIGAGGDQVLGRQIGGADGQHADPPAGRQQPLDKRDLHQARRGDRHPDVISDFALQQRQKTAICREAIGAEADKLGGGFKKIVEQARGLVAHDAGRRGAWHDFVENWKRPGHGVAHIARDARKARLEHQDAETRAIERLAAPDDARFV